MLKTKYYLHRIRVVNNFEWANLKAQVYLYQLVEIKQIPFVFQILAVENKEVMQLFIRLYESVVRKFIILEQRNDSFAKKKSRY